MQSLIIEGYGMKEVSKLSKKNTWSHSSFLIKHKILVWSCCLGTYSNRLSKIIPFKHSGCVKFQRNKPYKVRAFVKVGVHDCYMLPKLTRRLLCRGRHICQCVNRKCLHKN